MTVVAFFLCRALMMMMMLLLFVMLLLKEAERCQTTGLRVGNLTPQELASTEWAFAVHSVGK